MSVLECNLNQPASWSIGCQKLGFLFNAQILLCVGLFCYLSLTVVETMVGSAAPVETAVMCEAERCVSSTLSTFVVAFLAGGLVNVDVLKRLPIL